MKNAVPTKLISMKDFVLEQADICQEPEEFELKVIEYADFLNQPLTLGMFVPCDEEGNVLEEPEHIDYVDTDDNKTGSIDNDSYYDDLKQYHKAKERVLFEGSSMPMDRHINTIEDLVKYKLYLTESAIKQIGL